MRDAIFAELARFVAALIDAQQVLLDLLRKKRAALSAADRQALDALHESELDSARRLQTLTTWRARLLESARSHGFAGGTLTDLAMELGASAAGIVARFQESRRLASAIQHESWVQWVITNRCCNFYTELLELIAQGGIKSPTYHDIDRSRRGGVVLDASA